MYIFDTKQEYSNEMLDFAMEKNILDKYLLMFSYCTSDKKELKYDRYNQMKSMYSYYKEHPESEIDKKLYDILMMLSKTYTGEQVIDCVLGIVKTHLYFKKQEKNTFDMDCQAILNVLRNTINNRKSTYMKKPNIFKKPFWNTIENYDREIAEEYGCKVL